MNLNNLEDFKIIGCRFSSSSKAHHDLFVKEHSIRNQSEDKPAGRTLFIANIPPWATEVSFKRVFSEVGPIETVTFQHSLKNTNPPTDNGFQFGFVVFVKSADLRKSLNLAGRVLDFSTTKHSILTGLRKWVREYNESLTDQEKLREQVTQAIAKYDKDEAEKSKSKELTDDDGWTLVTKKSKSSKALTENGDSKWSKKQKKKEGLKNFYTFQIKESKMNEIAALRKKHEEDKKKIEVIKKARKFKPY